MSARLLHYSDVENAFDDPERIGRLAGLLVDLDGDDAVVVGSGDNTAPGVLSLVTEGRHSLPFFEAVGADFDTFGNHDFDYGPAATRELVADSPQTWLTANVHETSGDAGGVDANPNSGADSSATGDAPRFASEHTEPWTVRDVDGVAVGFFGVTTPATNSINPNATDVAFSDPIAAGERAAAACREAGAEFVVAVSHLGTEDEELAVAADVDVVLGGHVHSEVVERVDDAVLLRPGVNGRLAYEVALDASADGERHVDVERHEAATATVHEGVADAMRAAMERADLTEVVAHVEDPIERTHAAAFRGESRIGNFVADAYRWATGADVGLQNSGGVREGDPLEGAVTIADVMSVVPFQEPVAVAELTGAELKRTIRQAHGANLAFGEPDWWHAHLSGASVVWDRETEEIIALRVDGDLVDDDATYTLATTDYLFHTDHEFPALDAQHRVDVGDVQYEVLAAYARENGLDPQLEGRVAWSD